MRWALHYMHCVVRQPASTTTYEERSLRSDLLLLYRILNSLIIVPNLEFKSSVSRCNRLIVSRPCCSLERSFYVHRTSMLWNRYLTKLDFSSRSAFKKSVMSLPLSSSLRGSAFKAIWAVRAVWYTLIIIIIIIIFTLTDEGEMCSYSLPLCSWALLRPLITPRLFCCSYLAAPRSLCPRCSLGFCVSLLVLCVLGLPGYEYGF